MIIEIQDKLVSTDLLTEQFVCNLSACKGACCVHGTSGAPLTMEEVSLIEDAIEEIKPFLGEKGRAEIEKKGVFYMDEDNEPVTMLNKGKECAFMTSDEKGISKCGIETAYREGAIPFNKPASCHLYPLRENKLKNQLALHYNRWPICSDACALGKELKVPVYKFLKEPIIRVYGQTFYDEMDTVAEGLKKEKKEKGTT